MIRRVGASQDGFKSVEFTSGLNVILAERTEQSTDKDTRNGLGKSLLLDIVHFCLGSKPRQKTGLRVKELQEWSFKVDLQMRGETTSVTRSSSGHGRVKFPGKTKWSQWPIQPQIEHRLEQCELRVADWNTVLGWALYGIEDDSRKYTPSFRSLVSYDIRRTQYSDPFVHFSRQFIWDKQVHNAFMLDLNWEHARRWQLLRDRSKSIDIVKKALREGNNLIADMVGATVGEMEYQRDRLQRQIQETDAELQQFRVHPQYERIEARADSLTSELHDLANDILHVKRLLEFHRRSIHEEDTVRTARVAELYEEAGVVLPDIVTKRLDDVRSFHIQVTRNRKQYLESETQRLQEELGQAIDRQKRLSTERAALLRFLETHGALQDYNELQQLSLDQHARLKEIEEQIKQRRQIDVEQSEIKIEQGRLDLDARRDMEERTSRKLAASIFDANSVFLYQSPGALILDIDSKAGLKMDVDIERADSLGVSKMKVFCYDLMRAELWSQREVRPGFLIHDSDIFAGVDERQVARALELAERKTRECGFQYIVCLNSDQVPRDEFSDGFDFDSFVRLKLTDATPEGSLLGMRF